jgi:hypothetical protein
MTFFGEALLTAVATVVLALFAIVTAWYARKAFLKQSQEEGSWSALCGSQRSAAPFLTRRVNACQPDGGKVRAGPPGSLESRTATVRAAVATSMQLSLDALL